LVPRGRREGKGGRGRKRGDGMGGEGREMGRERILRFTQIWGRISNAYNSKTVRADPSISFYRNFA